MQTKRKSKYFHLKYEQNTAKINNCTNRQIKYFVYKRYQEHKILYSVKMLCNILVQKNSKEKYYCFYKYIYKQMFVF